MAKNARIKRQIRPGCSRFSLEPEADFDEPASDAHLGLVVDGHTAAHDILQNRVFVLDHVQMQLQRVSLITGVFIYGYMGCLS